MSDNRGKKFEQDFENSRLSDMDVQRIYDPQGGFKSVASFADFHCFYKGRMFYFELKSRKDKYFQIGGKSCIITDNQWKGLLDKSLIPGVRAGVIMEWADYHEHYYFPIMTLYNLEQEGIKSIKVEDAEKLGGVKMHGIMPRTRWKFDLAQLFHDIAPR